MLCFAFLSPSSASFLSSSASSSSPFPNLLRRMRLMELTSGGAESWHRAAPSPPAAVPTGHRCRAAPTSGFVPGARTTKKPLQHPAPSFQPRFGEPPAGPSPGEHRGGPGRFFNYPLPIILGSPRRRVPSPHRPGAAVPEGTVLRSHTPSFSSLSRISQLNMPAFSRLYSSIFFSTSGVVTCFSKDKASGQGLCGRGRRGTPEGPAPFTGHGPERAPLVGRAAGKRGEHYG